MSSFCSRIPRRQLCVIFNETPAENLHRTRVDAHTPMTHTPTIDEEQAALLYEAQRRECATQDGHVSPV